MVFTGSSLLYRSSLYLSLLAGLAEFNVFEFELLPALTLRKEARKFNT